MNTNKTHARLIILFILGLLFLNYPLLSLFSKKAVTFLSIPLLYAFVYIFWGALIVISFLIIEFQKKNRL